MSAQKEKDMSFLDELDLARVDELNITAKEKAYRNYYLTYNFNIAKWERGTSAPEWWVK